jgi:hypothetical protein
MGEQVKAKKVWCVQHREGWCMRSQQAKRNKYSDQVPTFCQMAVCGPYGFAFRLPDCKDCIARIKRLALKRAAPRKALP